MSNATLSVYYLILLLIQSAHNLLTCVCVSGGAGEFCVFLKDLVKTIKIPTWVVNCVCSSMRRKTNTGV